MAFGTLLTLEEQFYPNKCPTLFQAATRADGGYRDIAFSPPPTLSSPPFRLLLPMVDQFEGLLNTKMLYATFIFRAPGVLPFSALRHNMAFAS